MLRLGKGHCDAQAFVAQELLEPSLPPSRGSRCAANICHDASSSKLFRKVTQTTEWALLRRNGLLLLFVNVGWQSSRISRVKPIFFIFSLFIIFLHFSFSFNSLVSFISFIFLNFLFFLFFFFFFFGLLEIRFFWPQLLQDFL